MFCLSRTAPLRRYLNTSTTRKRVGRDVNYSLACASCWYCQPMDLNRRARRKQRFLCCLRCLLFNSFCPVRLDERFFSLIRIQHSSFVNRWMHGTSCFPCQGSRQPILIDNKRNKRSCNDFGDSPAHPGGCQCGVDYAGELAACAGLYTIKAGDC